ncbi:DUF4430 domain-containing protein [Thermobrachium celere]|uniref:Transcobalamin-like C-terminal domain-containing protein n=1 Tax=Thermobrachium celere DSM 8682 TaxID=941824 RepID=R7RTR5_9CLOT|nr:DUF4430 domain-containing protein [Thermobrachium celere]CDF58683.1 hypothetical protein TCEL_00729 [Thermobrachium celere DSM 8682]
MKKKLLLIVAMLVISISAISFAGSLQNKLQGKDSKKIVESNKQSKLENKEVKKEDIQKQTKPDNKNSKQSSNIKEKNNQKQIENKQTAKQQKSNGVSTLTDNKKNTLESRNTIKKPNVYIIDTINNKVIYKGYVEINSKTAAEVTLKVLIENKISYRTKGTGSSIYFSSIAGLRERDYGEKSGWCYYVNGVKAPVGAGGYILKNGDILEWKYLEDGLK